MLAVRNASPNPAPIPNAVNANLDDGFPEETKKNLEHRRKLYNLCVHLLNITKDASPAKAKPIVDLIIRFSMATSHFFDSLKSDGKLGSLSMVLKLEPKLLEDIKSFKVIWSRYLDCDI